jgi:hypothetical protein
MSLNYAISAVGERSQGKMAMHLDLSWLLSGVEVSMLEILIF